VILAKRDRGILRICTVGLLKPSFWSKRTVAILDTSGDPKLPSLYCVQKQTLLGHKVVYCEVSKRAANHLFKIK